MSIFSKCYKTCLSHVKGPTFLWPSLERQNDIEGHLKASNSRPDQEIFFETGYIWCSNVNYHISQWWVLHQHCWMENMYTLYGQNVKNCKVLEDMQLLVNNSYAWKISNFWKIYNIFTCTHCMDKMWKIVRSLKTCNC